MAEEKVCPHCGGSGTCDKFNEQSSCPDCCQTAGLELAYFQGYVPCAVCNGTGKIDDKPASQG